MLTRSGQMRLTSELVARVPLYSGPKLPLAEGFRAPTDDEYRTTIDEIMAREAFPDSVWVFTYGSLIWKPGFDHIDRRIGRAAGWSRSFCLGWDRRYRGSPERPGLMMALDEGSFCEGVLYRLPDDAIDANLDSLFRREMPFLPTVFPARWIDVVTDEQPLRCLTFVMDRNAGAYIDGLSDAEIADALAIAAGELGSMAEYLYATVLGLEELGIHDEHLWSMQELVAERIEARWPASSGV